MMKKEFVGQNDSMPPAPSGYKHSFDLAGKPRKASLGVYTGDRHARKDWRELMDFQEKHQSSPWHHWKGAGVKVKDQKTSSYCWSFGSAGAVQTRYAQQGMGDACLSATSVAAPITNFNKDKGGWGSYFFEHVQEHGIASTRTWPELKMDRSLLTNKEVLSDRFQHDVPCFEEHDYMDLDSVVSALLDPIDPCPVTLGYSYWGHLVFGTRATFTDGKITLWIVNSWGEDWNGDGTVKLVGEDKCRPAEAISICGVKPITKLGA